MVISLQKENKYTKLLNKFRFTSKKHKIFIYSYIYLFNDKILNSSLLTKGLKLVKKTFECIVCGIQFSFKSILLTHQRTLTGEKLYYC